MAYHIKSMVYHIEWKREGDMAFPFPFDVDIYLTSIFLFHHSPHEVPRRHFLHGATHRLHVP